MFLSRVRLSNIDKTKISRRKRLSSGTNFVLDYLEIYGTRIY